MFYWLSIRIIVDNSMINGQILCGLSERTMKRQVRKPTGQGIHKNLVEIYK